MYNETCQTDKLNSIYHSGSIPGSSLVVIIGGFGWNCRLWHESHGDQFADIRESNGFSLRPSQLSVLDEVFTWCHPHGSPMAG